MNLTFIFKRNLWLLAICLLVSNVNAQNQRLRANLEEIKYSTVKTTNVAKSDAKAPHGLTANYNSETNIVDLAWKDVNTEKPTVILEEGFETDDFLTTGGWTIKTSAGIDSEQSIPGEGVVTWAFAVKSTEPKNWNDRIHSGERAMGIPYSATQFHWLTTPEIEAKNGYKLSFWTWYNSGKADDGKTYITNFRVMVLSEDSWNEELFYNSEAQSNTLESIVEIDLSKYADKNIQIAFVYEGTDGWGLTVDDVKIEGSAKKGNSKDAEFAGYKVYRNGEELTTISDVATTTYQDDISSLEDGDYTYKVSALWKEGENTEESDPTNEVTVTKGGGTASAINTQELENVKLYPNPNMGTFTIDLGEYNNAEWTLTNANGQIIKSAKATNQIVNVNGIESGLYFVKVTSTKGTKVFKVVVK